METKATKVTKTTENGKGQAQSAHARHAWAIAETRVNRRVHGLLCPECWGCRRFMREPLRPAGVRGSAGTVAGMSAGIVRAPGRREDPPVALDEADKLSERSPCLLVSRQNRLEGRAGIVLCATDYLEKRIRQDARTNRKGYRELYSRIGSRFIPLQAVNGEDIAAVCAASGVADPKVAEGIIDDSGGDLRRVRRKIHAVRQNGVFKWLLKCFNPF